MRYKVVFVCYLKRNWQQRQKAFITKATDNVRIEEIDREIHMPLIIVKFFKTKKEAVKEAELCCHPDDIKNLLA